MLAEIEQRSNDRMLRVVGHLDEHATQDLLEAMTTIRRLLEKGNTDAAPG